MLRISVLPYCILTVNVVLSQNINIPDVIYETCPYSNICNRTASLTLNDNGLVSCCKSCGCDPECGLRFDCCFDFLDKYNLIGQHKAACIDPVVGNKAVTTFEGMFYIVKSCDFQAKDNGEPVKFCNVTDQDGNSLVEPVSSLKTGYIYINAGCAYCNRVWDFKRWNFVFFSGIRTEASVMWSVLQHAQPSKEARVYVPPSNEDWSSKQCYPPFTVYKPCDVRPELQYLCDNLNAPYTSRTTVDRNVICEYCQNESDLPIPRECEKSTKGASSNSIIVLIDDLVMSEFSLWKNKQRSIIKSIETEGCPSNTYRTSYDCLQIWCPDAMIMTLKGCKYVIKTWFINVFFIQMRLTATPIPSLLKSDLYSISDQERTNPLSWIHSPCIQLQPLIVIMYHTIIFNNEGLVESLKIDLWKTSKNNGIQPDFVFSILGRCLKSTWSLNVKNTSHYFISSPASRIDQLFYPQIVSSKNSHVALAVGPGKLVLTMMRTAIPIRKTFFCNQVRVPSHEVIQQTSDTILLLSNNVTLGNNEYTKNVADNINETTFSVCLTDIDPDFRFVQEGKGNGSKPQTRKGVNLMLLIFFLYGLEKHFIKEI